MKTLVCLALLALTTAATATDGFFHASTAPGFFRGPGPLVMPPRGGELAPKIDGFACGLLVRFHAITPDVLEITYIGSACVSSFLQAVRAAEAQPAPVPPGKNTNGEPARAPSYQCQTSILWNPTTVSSPQVTVSGGESCEAVRSAAMRAAVQAVSCMYLQNTPCRR